MLLSKLTSINFQVYNEGRAKATTRTFDEQDIREFLIMAVNEIWRILYYASKRNKDGEPFYFVSPTLSIQSFALGKANEIGMRRADMGKYDILQLPHDLHIVNIYPVGCGGTESKSIYLAEASEERFYIGKPKFKSFKFARVLGRGLNTYNLPACVQSLDVESTFAGADVDPDISIDVAYDASNVVLGRFIGLPDFQNMGTDNSLTPAKRILRQRISNQQQPEIQG